MNNSCSTCSSDRVTSVELPDEYKYVIDRLGYDISMRDSNLAFMICQNQDNPDFIGSELYEQMIDDCIDSRINSWIVLRGIVEVMGITSRFDIESNESNTGYIITY